jgi:hypothetical protein
MFFFRVSFIVSYQLFDKLLLERFLGHFFVLKSFSSFFNNVRNFFQTGTFLNLFLLVFLSCFIVISNLLLF